MAKIALLFPGQGAQYVGMGKILYEKFSVVKELFQEANELLGFDLKKLCFEGDLTELTKTENAQPAILTVSFAAFKAYMQEFGMMPSCMAGHSLGEFSALTAAGVISFADAVLLVRQRGRFMQEAISLGGGVMSAISGLEIGKVEEGCKQIALEGKVVTISNYNSPEQVVISGHKEAVAQVSERLAALGATVIPLKVSAPFHCSLMESAAVKLGEELGKYTYRPLQVPVLSNVTALPYESQDTIVELLKQQMTEPVQWAASMQYMQQQGIEITIEVGPGHVLKNLMKINAPHIQAYAYDKNEDVQFISKIISAQERIGARTTPKANTNVVTKCIAIAVCTRNRNWNNDEYQKGVVDPYRKVQKIQDELDQSGQQPTFEQMREALQMLISVFETKLVPMEERIERYNEVLDETGTHLLFADFIFADAGVRG